MVIASRLRHRAPGRAPRSIRGIVALVALAVSLAMPGLVFAWDASAFSSSDEALLVQLTNQARASAGLKALTVDSTLTNVARWRSKDMIERNYFSHTIPPANTKVFDELQRIGYCYVAAGENIGTNNYPDDIATASIQDGFMGSTGHRNNILGTAWTVVGVGAYKGPDGKHMWTVLFAQKCASAPAPTVKPTPAPTPKPTATPTPKPTTGPTATAEATPKPTVKPTAQPTSVPTPEPTSIAAATIAPTAVADPTAAATAAATAAPTAAPDERGTTGPAGGPAEPAPASTPAPQAFLAGPAGLQVIDAPVSNNLVDTIVGDVAGAYFGS